MKNNTQWPLISNFLLKLTENYILAALGNLGNLLEVRMLFLKWKMKKIVK